MVDDYPGCETRGGVVVKKRWSVRGNSRVCREEMNKAGSGSARGRRGAEKTKNRTGVIDRSPSYYRITCLLVN